MEAWTRRLVEQPIALSSRRGGSRLSNGERRRPTRRASHAIFPGPLMLAILPGIKNGSEARWTKSELVWKLMEVPRVCIMGAGSWRRSDCKF